jgi:hypothetical protein
VLRQASLVTVRAVGGSRLYRARVEAFNHDKHWRIRLS